MNILRGCFTNHCVIHTEHLVSSQSNRDSSFFAFDYFVPSRCVAQHVLFYIFLSCFYTLSCMSVIALYFCNIFLTFKNDKKHSFVVYVQFQTTLSLKHSELVDVKGKI